MINYTVYNLSTVVNSSQLSSMVKAINNYLISFCNDWGLASINLNIGVYNSHMGLQNDSIFILDYTDSEGSLGYHFEDNGYAIGRVFAKTILEYGGVVLYINAPGSFSVSQCLSHELLEMIGNPEINLWALDNYGNMWARELCDSVESNLIVYTLPGNIKVGLSDYVLQSWFSPDSISGPYNKKNTLSYPFQIDQNGYAIVIENITGDVVSLYGMNPTYSQSFTYSGTQSMSYIMSTQSSKFTYFYGTNSHHITYGMGTFSSSNKLLTYQNYDAMVNVNKRGVRISKIAKSK